jgi:hypothetical protein
MSSNILLCPAHNVQQYITMSSHNVQQYITMSSNILLCPAHDVQQFTESGNTFAMHLFTFSCQHAAVVSWFALWIPILEGFCHSENGLELYRIWGWPSGSVLVPVVSVLLTRKYVFLLFIWPKTFYILRSYYVISLSSLSSICRYNCFQAKTLDLVDQFFCNVSTKILDTDTGFGFGLFLGVCSSTRFQTRGPKVAKMAFSVWLFLFFISCFYQDMVVGFTPTYAVNAYHHFCELYSWFWKGALDTTACDEVYLWLEAGLLVALISSTNKYDSHWS